MKNNVKSEINKIEVPKQLDSYIQSGVESATKNRGEQVNKKIRLSFVQIFKNKKILYTLGAGAIVFILLLTTLLQSKTMLVYASEVPFISSMFNLKPLPEQIIDELEEKDYYTDNIDISVPVFSGKEILISLGGTSNYQYSIMDDIRITVERFLHNNQYDSFTVNVQQQDDQASYHITNAQQTEKENMEQEIKGLVSELNIDIEHVFVEPLDKYISVTVNASINNEKELQEYAQSIKKELLDHTDFKEYEFHVTVSGPEVSVGNDGSTLKPLTDLDKKIGGLAGMLTGNEMYKVTGFSYKEDPLIFEIKTSVSSSEEEHGIYLQNVIGDYFNSTNVPPVIEKDSYQLYIYSKDGKKIN
ncbi:hypothetical protein GMD78_00215 [Ornithinibacillus sp. L9]|uniref:Uncharacterized protein n=1 Tax=Ornithinibacillus caprae TaxID=2678566 RepID=A0A6N8FDU3_9BACI|nr:DUF4179 domain-containing protein [Ornithinibacillus caprae]MUK86826.1 hypothetical protein [Ornithinibacillus caprae]